MLPLIITTTSTIASQLRSLRDTFFTDEDLNIKDAIEYYNIQTQFPWWLIERHHDSSVGSFFIPLVQRYYDWLYSEDGYGLGLHEVGEIQFLRLIDIDRTPVHMLKHFFYTYASGFPLDVFEARIGDLNEGDGLPDQMLRESSYIRDFIKGIKQNLYQRKSNEKSFEYFFQTLYGVGFNDGDYGGIKYPKIDILRLNGGVPAGYEYFNTYEGDNGHYINDTAFYSVLNVSNLQDGYWYQEYSYIVNVDVDSMVDSESGEVIYEDIIKGVLHPAGMLGFYQFTLDDYIPPDDTDEDYNFAEIPVLGNYFPYRLTDTSGLTACVGCSGSEFTYDGIGYSHGGLSGAGIAGWSGATFNIPTYNFPNWAAGISQTSNPDGTLLHFGYIHIGDFKFLYEANESPNLGVTGCTAYCDSAAGSCWPGPGC